MHRAKLSTVFALGALLALSGVPINEAEACGVKLIVKNQKKPSRARLRARALKKRIAIRTSRDKRNRERQLVAQGGNDNRVAINKGAGATTARRARPAATPTRPTPVKRGTSLVRKEPVVAARVEAPKPKVVAKVTRPTTKPEAPKVAMASTSRASDPVETARPKRKPRKEPVVAANVEPISIEVYFDLGAARSAESELQEAIAWLQANPSGRLVIEGHTDASGSASFNQRLSVKRAKSVRRQLVNLAGVPSRRIKVKGFGESRIEYPDDDDKNRRVVIRNR